MLLIDSKSKKHIKFGRCASTTILTPSKSKHHSFWPDPWKLQTLQCKPPPSLTVFSQRWIAVVGVAPEKTAAVSCGGLYHGDH